LFWPIPNLKLTTIQIGSQPTKSRILIFKKIMGIEIQKCRSIPFFSNHALRIIK